MTQSVLSLLEESLFLSLLSRVLLLVYSMPSMTALLRSALQVRRALPLQAAQNAQRDHDQLHPEIQPDAAESSAAEQVTNAVRLMSCPEQADFASSMDSLWPAC